MDTLLHRIDIGALPSGDSNSQLASRMCDFIDTIENIWNSLPTDNADVFDTVSNAKLLRVFQHPIGLGRIALEWSTPYLSGCTQAVSIRNPTAPIVHNCYTTTGWRPFLHCGNAIQLDQLASDLFPTSTTV